MDVPFSEMKIELPRAPCVPRWSPWFVAAGLFFMCSVSLFGQVDTVGTLREKIDQAERERMEICRILGAIYEEIGDTDKAIESYRMGFQVYPDDPFLCNKLIELYKSRERWTEIAPIYKSLINANPGANEKYMKELAECYLKAGQRQEAVQAILEMLDEYGEDATDYRDAAQIFMAQEEYEAAASICRRGIEGKFGNSGDLHSVLGRALGKLEKYSEAVLAYETALELSPQQYKRALEEELAELCKEEAVVEQILERKLGSLRALDERLAELYWQKALKCEEEGEVDAAVALYRKIVALVPDSERGKNAERKIRELVSP